MRVATLRSPSSQINVTPYIDILLVLLIIFMVIQPTTQYDLKARVPETPTEAPAEPVFPSAAIVVSIESDGSIRVNRQITPRPELGSTLFDILSRRADKSLFVQAREDLPFGDAIDVIDIAKGAGAGEVGLLTGSTRD